MIRRGVWRVACAKLLLTKDGREQLQNFVRSKREREKKSSLEKKEGRKLTERGLLQLLPVLEKGVTEPPPHALRHNI
jgi:hypothetical protein